MLLVAGAVALALAGSAGAKGVPKLKGTVGPGFTITLADAKGKTVKTLKAGKYRITVQDKASIHSFHLKGPGVDKVITDVGFTGTKSVKLTLKSGSYTFFCDPHASSIHGSFKVV